MTKLAPNRLVFKFFYERKYKAGEKQIISPLITIRERESERRGNRVKERRLDSAESVTLLLFRPSVQVARRHFLARGNIFIETQKVACENLLKFIFISFILSLKSYPSIRPQYFINSIKKIIRENEIKKANINVPPDACDEIHSLRCMPSCNFFMITHIQRARNSDRKKNQKIERSCITLKKQSKTHF